MTTRVPDATVKRFLTVLGVLALFWTLLHAGLTAVALTSGQTSGSMAGALQVMTYTSPILALLSFCGAGLAFSGRTATRRPGLAGAAFLVMALVIAMVAAGCAGMLIRDAELWVLFWLPINLPLIVAVVVFRRVFRSAQRSRLRDGPDWAGTGTSR